MTRLTSSACRGFLLPAPGHLPQEVDASSTPSAAFSFPELLSPVEYSALPPSPPKHTHTRAGEASKSLSVAHWCVVVGYAIPLVSMTASRAWSEGLAVLNSYIAGGF